MIYKKYKLKESTERFAEDFDNLKIIKKTNKFVTIKNKLLKLNQKKK